MVTFTCACGKKLRVQDALVGKKIKCPGCAAIQVVAAEPLETPRVGKEAIAPAPPVASRPPVASSAPSLPPMRPVPSIEFDPAPRVWHDAIGLVYFSRHLIAAPFLRKGAYEQAAQEIEAGDDIETVVDRHLDNLFREEGAPAPYFGTAMLEEIAIDLRSKRIDFKYREGRAVKSIGTNLGEPQREEMFEFFKNNLGPEWTESTKEQSRFVAVLTPLIAGFFVVGMLAVLGLLVYWETGPIGPRVVIGNVGIETQRQHARRSFINFIMEWIPYWVFWAAAGVMAIFFLLWTITVFRSPPMLRSLKRASE